MPSEQPALTRNQTVVLAALKRADTPMTAYEILGLDEVREAGLKAPLTIYRALDKLIAAGLVHRIESINAFLVCERRPHPGPAGFAICDTILGLDEVREAGLKAPLTIYRALDKLIAAGLVHRIESINAFLVCERRPHPGPAGFAICDTCRKTVELTLTDCETHLTENARRAGFRVDAMNVEMHGRCADCLTEK